MCRGLLIYIKDIFDFIRVYEGLLGFTRVSQCILGFVIRVHY